MKIRNSICDALRHFWGSNRAATQNLSGKSSLHSTQYKPLKPSLRLSLGSTPKEGLVEHVICMANHQLLHFHTLPVAALCPPRPKHLCGPKLRDCPLHHGPPC